MKTPPRSQIQGVPTLTLMGAAAGLGAAAWLEVSGFAGFLAAALTVAVFVQLSDASPGLRLPAATCTAAFPFLVMQGGEAGLLWGSALTVATLAIASVLIGRTRGLVSSLASAVLIVVYPAVLASHLILMKGFPRGSEMVVSFLFMAGGYLAAASVVERWRGGRPGAGTRRNHNIWPRWDAIVAGLIAAQAIAFAVRAVLRLPLEVGTVAILALVVSAAAAVGGLIGASLSEEGRGKREEPVVGLEYLNALLMAAPAFYYGFRLYLS